MAFLREGAVKDLVSRGPKLEDVVAWAEDFVLHDDIVPTPSIPDYVRGHGLSLPEFETLVNIHLGDAEDPHSEDVIMRLLGELEAINMNENKKNNMKDSIIAPRLLKEDHHKECSDEVQMAKIQLKSIMADAGELLQSLDQCEQLDAWVQSKIALAEDYITSVAKYMKYEEEAPAQELPIVPAPELEEPVGPDMVAPEVTPEEAPMEEPSEDDLAVLSQPEEEVETEIEVEAKPLKVDEPEEEDFLSFDDLEECGIGMNETHLSTKSEKIKWLCKNDKSCKKEELEKLSAEEVDKKYAALEKKMGMRESIVMPRMKSL